MQLSIQAYEHDRLMACRLPRYSGTSWSWRTGTGSGSRLSTTLWDAHFDAEGCVWRNQSMQRSSGAKAGKTAIAIRHGERAGQDCGETAPRATSYRRHHRDTRRESDETQHARTG